MIIDNSFLKMKLVFPILYFLFKNTFYCLVSTMLYFLSLYTVEENVCRGYPPLYGIIFYMWTEIESCETV